ncbi:hypothetical protein [Bacillus sp. EE-W1]|uniref:hypothetical protein n=1 Tax=Bacillus sp. EE-W1 TaxID=2662453 RepID=UPI0012F848BD|nr:hypothetical protein [Bacillus sp. EE-W1]
MKRKYEVINMIGGTKLTITDEVDIAITCSHVLQVFFDLDKEWKVDKTDRYDKEDALMITGNNSEDGEWTMMLLIAKDKADADAEMYEKYESVN